MPTISEDGGPGGTDRDSNYSGDESNFEQLMVNMLDERDRLMETLRESQETLAVTQAKLQEAERDRDAFQKQLSATQPQVLPSIMCTNIIDFIENMNLCYNPKGAIQYSLYCVESVITFQPTNMLICHVCSDFVPLLFDIVCDTL